MEEQAIEGLIARIKRLLRHRQTRLAFKWSDDPVFSSVQRGLRGQFDPEELDYLALIENLKDEMIRAHRLVKMVYYGVGGPTRDCSPEQLRHGVTIMETTG